VLFCENVILNNGKNVAEANTYAFLLKIHLHVQIRVSCFRTRILAKQ
jgi:hypothetical protein